MSELKSYLCIEAKTIEHKDFLCYRFTSATKSAPEACMEEVYLKSEADAVIAELYKKLDLYKRGWAENDRINAYLYAELRHQKYKRCLAMASLSLEKRETYRAEYEEWCLKWYKRWLELAEKFKEAK